VPDGVAGLARWADLIARVFAVIAVPPEAQNIQLWRPRPRAMRSPITAPPLTCGATARSE